MPCSYTRKDVSRIVQEVLRHIHQDPTIVEATVFGPQGINVDAMFRSTYFFPIKMSVEKVDCLIKKFNPADCENAGAVSDIVDAVWDDFKPVVSGAMNISSATTTRATTTKAKQPKRATRTRKTKKR